METPERDGGVGGAGSSDTKGFVSTLRSVLTVDADAPPARGVPLESVPVIGARTRPVNGVSLYYGKSDLAAVMQGRFQAAFAAGELAFEVVAKVDLGPQRPITALRADDLSADRERPPAEKHLHILNLPRLTQSAELYLQESFANEICQLRDPETGEIDTEVQDWKFSRVVSRYPHLLDLMASRAEFRHVIMYVWEADTVGPVDRGGVVEGAKIATLYRPECVIEMETLSADFVRAVLPVLGVDAEAAQVIENKAPLTMSVG